VKGIENVDMMNYNTIKLIATYEIKLFGRDRGLVSILFVVLLVTAFIHIITQSNVVSPEWLTIALPAAIPFTNVYIVNLLQTLIIIFWAGASIQEEQRADSFSSISVRPFSNMEWLIGKTVGFLCVMLLLHVVCMGVGMSIHLFLSDSPFALWPYVVYFFTLSVPIVLFATGLTLFIKGILRKRFLAILFLLVLFYFGTIIFAERFYGVSDLFLLFQPNVFSEVTGITPMYFLQRFMFFLLGCGLIIAGIHLITRLPNVKQRGVRIRGLYMTLIAAAMISAFCYLQQQIGARQYHERLRDVFVKYEGQPKARITEHDITFEQNGGTYQATSSLHVCNPHEETLPVILLYLNPGLEVVKLSENGADTPFNREEQVIVIPTSLSPHVSRKFEIQYQGDIVPEVCYAEVENLGVLRKFRQYYHFNMGTDFHYLRENFTLLTPECLWYPVAVPPVNVLSPITTIQNYTKFHLAVIGEKERMPISQGQPEQKGDTLSFKNEMPLPGISLCVGDYTRKELTVGDVCFEAYFLKQHKDFWPDMPGLFPIVLQYWLEDLDRINQAYVFDKLACIEVPVNYCAYARTWKAGSEYVQPEMIFRPEREALRKQGVKIPTESSLPGVPPEAEWFSVYTRDYSSSRMIRTGFPVVFEKNEFTGNEYDVTALLQKHHVQITSPEFPGIQRVCQGLQNYWRNVLHSYNDNPDYTTASMYFDDHCLQDVLQESQESLHFQQCLAAKSITFLTRILYSIPPERFRKFVDEFYSKHGFSEVNYKQLCEELRQIDSLDLWALTRQLYSEKGLPDFRIRDARVQRVEDIPGKEGYIQSLKVWNKGAVDGMITISGDGLERNVHYLVPAGACKELRTYIPGESETFSFQVQTNLARNIPAYYNFKNLEPEETCSRFICGMFDIDTLYCMDAPDEFVVDNEDEGFHVIDSKQMLIRLAQEREKSGVPSYQHWVREYSYDCYGEPVKSYYIRLAGNGESKVQWKTILPSEGMYELFVYHGEKLFRRNGYLRNFVGKERQIISNPTQTYVFAHVEGEETVVVETENAGYGWVSLGIFPFAAGEVSITLLDVAAAPSQAIIGDAVKWKKVR